MEIDCPIEKYWFGQSCRESRKVFVFALGTAFGAFEVQW
jgi:hypothetical protein